MTLTTAEHERMLAFRENLFRAVRGWDDDQEVLLRIVNERRAQNGLDPIAIDEVRAVGESATGNDYVEKFALRLAFLAYGLDWRP